MARPIRYALFLPILLIPVGPAAFAAGESATPIPEAEPPPAPVAAATDSAAPVPAPAGSGAPVEPGDGATKTAPARADTGPVYVTGRILSPDTRKPVTDATVSLYRSQAAGDAGQGIHAYPGPYNALPQGQPIILENLDQIQDQGRWMQLETEVRPQLPIQQAQLAQLEDGIILTIPPQRVASTLPAAITRSIVNGTFVLRAPSPGHYSLLIQWRAGYPMQGREIDVPAGGLQVPDITIGAPAPPGEDGLRLPQGGGAQRWVFPPGAGNNLYLFYDANGVQPGVPGQGNGAMVQQLEVAQERLRAQIQALQEEQRKQMAEQQERLEELQQRRAQQLRFPPETQAPQATP